MLQQEKTKQTWHLQVTPLQKSWVRSKRHISKYILRYAKNLKELFQSKCKAKNKRGKKSTRREAVANFFFCLFFPFIINFVSIQSLSEVSFCECWPLTAHFLLSPHLRCQCCTSCFTQWCRLSDAQIDTRVCVCVCTTRLLKMFFLI